MLTRAARVAGSGTRDRRAAGRLVRHRRSVEMRNGHGHGCEQLTVGHIVGDERLQRAVTVVFGPALDKVCAAETMPGTSVTAATDGGVAFIGWRAMASGAVGL